MEGNDLLNHIMRSFVGVRYKSTQTLGVRHQDDKSHGNYKFTTALRDVTAVWTLNAMI